MGFLLSQGYGFIPAINCTFILPETLLDDYLHWYNNKRIKISLGGLSPIEYRKNLGLVA